MEPHFNFMAIAVASLIPLVMGFLYYHPSLFGAAWMRANGFSKETMSPPAPTMYLLALVVSFLFAFFIAANVTGGGGVDASQVTAPDGHSYVTFGHGLAHGVIFAITVLLPIFVTMKIFEQRSWGWAMVNWGYWALTVCVMGGLLSAWR